MTTIKSSILNRYINTLQTFVNSFSDDITDEIAKEKGLIIKKKISSLNAKEKADLQALIDYDSEAISCDIQRVLAALQKIDSRHSYFQACLTANFVAEKLTKERK